MYSVGSMSGACSVYYEICVKCVVCKVCVVCIVLSGCIVKCVIFNV